MLDVDWPLSPADFLDRAMTLNPPRDLNAVDCPPGTVCRVSARPITRGYRIMDIVTDANTEFLDQFRGNVHGYVSEAAARCYKSAAPKDKHLVGGRLVANPCAKSHLAVQLDGGEVDYVSPAFDPVTAVANETVPWSVAAREVWARHAGRNCFILITPDFKRRLWPYARTGILGERTPVFVLNKSYNLDGQFFLSWPLLLDHLDEVERLLNLGYSKASLRESLSSAPATTLEKIGVGLIGPKAPKEKPPQYSERALLAGVLHAKENEALLGPRRGRVEFDMAVMISARTLSAEESAKALAKKQSERAAQADEKAARTKAPSPAAQNGLHEVSP